jgi:nitrate/TMAO reductase-like tetraheme cytochrome c subunit
MPMRRRLTSHSYHAKAKQAGAPGATCQDCHGGAHEILAADDPKSPVNHDNIPATCGRCHGQKFLMESNGEQRAAFVAYQESVHGRPSRTARRRPRSAPIATARTRFFPPTTPSRRSTSSMFPPPAASATRDVQSVFMQSIHGQAIARGNGLAPVCTDCHGIHSIKAHIDPNSSVSEQNLSRTTCARCHEGVRLSQEFGVAGNRVSTYLDSYHGLASQGGSVVVANCASCHGVHNILPSSDPRSTINRANLDATCGKCHKGVTQKFTLTRCTWTDGGRARTSARSRCAG